MVIKSLLIPGLISLLSLNVFSQSDHNKKSGNRGKIETHVPGNGTLLVIGGAASNIFYEKFMELVGGPDGRPKGIPSISYRLAVTIFIC